MIRRRKSWLSMVLTLSIFGLAIFGGYKLYKNYEDGTDDIVERVKKASKILVED